jgi:hypothetical protein
MIDSYTKYLFFIIGLLHVSVSKAQQYQWLFNKNTIEDTLIIHSNYNLFNTSIQKNLIYKSTKKGINLGWQGGKSTPLNIVLVNPTGKDTLNSCGDVAILVMDAAAYLTYTEREYGITLGWSKTPVYEWRITTEDKACNTLKTRQKYGLFNLQAQKYLVYQEREDGFLALDWFEE